MCRRVTEEHRDCDLLEEELPGTDPFSSTPYSFLCRESVGVFFPRPFGFPTLMSMGSSPLLIFHTQGLVIEMSRLQVKGSDRGLLYCTYQTGGSDERYDYFPGSRTDLGQSHLTPNRRRRSLKTWFGLRLSKLFIVNP